ncbi:MAG: hypothetical protein MJZ28_09405 [Paludibacteraceae bacterium]|nr:hypothetical protein [Paludibacteraceae bacterium]
MRCYNCGNELSKGAKVCVSCGQKVGERQWMADGDLVGKGRKEPVGKKREASGFSLPWYYGLPLGIAVALIIAFLLFR